VRLFSFDDSTVVHAAVAFAPDDYWALGSTGTVLRYDGTVWTERMVSNLPRFGDMWGRAPNDIWLAGGDELWHYDGQTWSLHSAVHTPPGLELFGIHGDGANIWAVGGTDGTTLRADMPRVLKFDGHAWREETITAPEIPLAVWGHSGGFWAVGAEGMFLHHP